jgi:DNA-binding CsgD family transcriptional regulator
MCAYALIIHDRPEPALQALHQALQFADSSGLIAMAVMVRFFRTEALWRQGRWNDALAEITVALSIQEASGLRLLVPITKAAAARVLAGLGRAEDCQTAADEALHLCNALGLDMGLAWVHSARGLLHLGAGRFEQAVASLEHVAILARHLRQPGWLWWHADMVEALHAAGRLAEAKAILASLEVTIASTDTPTWATGARARCRALLRLDPAEDGYRRALETFTTIRAPFEQARTLLLRGRQRLHTGDGPGGYRDLAEARTIFDRLGARDWSAMASAARDEHQPDSLTLTARLSAKELPIALLVGNGATDRAVADQLFISSKTVSYHLGNIYAKLGIRNRAQLAAFVATEAATLLP